MGLGPDPAGAVSLRRCVTGALACGSYAVGLVRLTAFWGTILLPVVILVGLATELATAAPVRLVVLVGCNVLCILLGRSYNPTD